MPRGQDRVILTGVTLRRRDIADATVPVLVVVPLHERHGPFTGGFQICKAPYRELRSILGGAEQALGKGVVVAHARA